VLALKVLAIKQRFSIISAHIVYRDITMRVAHRNQMWVLLRELTTRDTVVCLNELFRESWVLKRPEAQVAALQLVVRLHTDIVLTIARRDQIWVGLVDVDTSNLAPLSEVAFECE
jgi:hypothetical protein